MENGNNRKREKMMKICKVFGGGGLILGLIVGIFGTKIVDHIGANKTKEAYTAQIQKAKSETKSLKEQLAGSQEEIAKNIAAADWNMILVNEEFPLSKDFKVDLDTLDGEYKADKRIIKDAKAMIAAAAKEDLNLVVQSAYRDDTKQASVFEQTMETLVENGSSYLDAYDEAKQSVNLPGNSEHATGLALDIVSEDYTELDEKFADTDEGKWLAAHCAEYGFILRYPKGKEGITGITYEPWHFRYVGTDMAKELTDKGITLEEYYGLN